MMFKINVSIINTVPTKLTILYSLKNRTLNLFSRFLCTGNGHHGLDIWVIIFYTELDSVKMCSIIHIWGLMI